MRADISVAMALLEDAAGAGKVNQPKEQVRNHLLFCLGALDESDGIRFGPQSQLSNRPANSLPNG
jgi:hypothetical protein